MIVLDFITAYSRKIPNPRLGVVTIIKIRSPCVMEQSFSTLKGRRDPNSSILVTLCQRKQQGRERGLIKDVYQY